MQFIRTYHFSRPGLHDGPPSRLPDTSMLEQHDTSANFSLRQIYARPTHYLGTNIRAKVEYERNELYMLTVYIKRKLLCYDI